MFSEGRTLARATALLSSLPIPLLPLHHQVLSSWAVSYFINMSVMLLRQSSLWSDQHCELGKIVNFVWRSGHRKTVGDKIHKRLTMCCSMRWPTYTEAQLISGQGLCGGTVIMPDLITDTSLLCFFFCLIFDRFGSWLQTSFRSPTRSRWNFPWSWASARCCSVWYSAFLTTGRLCVGW